MQSTTFSELLVILWIYQRISEPMNQWISDRIKESKKKKTTHQIWKKSIPENDLLRINQSDRMNYLLRIDALIPCQILQYESRTYILDCWSNDADEGIREREDVIHVIIQERMKNYVLPKYEHALYRHVQYAEKNI